MPKRDWLGNLTLAIVAAGFLAALIVVLTAIVLEQYAKVHEVYSRYQEYAAEDRRETQEEIAQACVGMTGQPFAKCVADKLETHHREQATNQDLQAQQDMAFWAFWLFVVSIAGLGTTVVGIYYVRRTLAANYEAIFATREVGQAQTRAYVACSGAKFGIDDEFLVCHVKLTNNGQSPAFRVSVEATITVWIIGPDGNPMKSVPASANSEVIQAGRNGFAIMVWGLKEMPATMASMLQSGHPFFVDCRVFWTDVFTNPLIADFSLSRHDTEEREYFDFLHMPVRGTMSASGRDLV